MTFDVVNGRETPTDKVAALDKARELAAAVVAAKAAVRLAQQRLALAEQAQEVHALEQQLSTREAEWR